jgi:hypothetical protein
MPWKNDGSTPMNWPSPRRGAGLADFAWRISCARMKRGGLFLVFPGLDHHLIIKGLDLLLNDQPTGQQLRPCSVSLELRRQLTRSVFFDSRGIDLPHAIPLSAATVNPRFLWLSARLAERPRHNVNHVNHDRQEHRHSHLKAGYSRTISA